MGARTNHITGCLMNIHIYTGPMIVTSLHGYLINVKIYTGPITNRIRAFFGPKSYHRLTLTVFTTIILIIKLRTVSK